MTLRKEIKFQYKGADIAAASRDGHRSPPQRATPTATSTCTAQWSMCEHCGNPIIRYARRPWRVDEHNVLIAEDPTPWFHVQRTADECQMDHRA